MGIGQRFPVKLIQIAVAIDANTGRNIETEGISFKTWAEITNPSNFRNYADGQTQLGKTKRFLIRFRFDKYPNADWKINYAGQLWTVSEIQKVSEKAFYWQFTATNKSDV
jgi:SPP1 family predicted phage head-tail adaptor